MDHAPIDRATIGVHRFHQLAVVTTIGICLVVVAGGVVRLTGSGLGCDDWPNCNDQRFVDVSSGHAAIEQINRIFSALLGVPTIALAIAAFRVRPATPGLRGPAIAVLVTVLANGVVGGLAVRGDLHPAIVQSHFLLAMISIAFGMIAIARSSRADEHVAEVVKYPTRVLAVTLAVASATALLSGTIVTGTGPHAGEENIRRFGFDISGVARLHSIVAIVSVVVALGLAWQLRRDNAGQRLLGPTLSAWIFIALLQGALGYVQYFNGVPELLVAVHIACATLLWVATIRLTDRAVGANAPSRNTQISATAASPA